MVIITPLLGQISYTTSCEIRDGKAYGYVRNHSDGFEINGDVWFYFYDSKGHFLEREDEHEYEYVSSKSTEEIEHTNAPSKASSCSFDVNNATEVKNSMAINTPTQALNLEIAYTTSCEIRDGKAYGYVRNHSDGFEINGEVRFYFYDSKGHFLDMEDEHEYEYVSSKSTEEIEHTKAPSKASSCSFDVKVAIAD